MLLKSLNITLHNIKKSDQDSIKKHYLKTGYWILVTEIQIENIDANYD
jgi:hypothetical protein